LRTCRKRPCRRRTAEQHDKFPSLQLIELHSVPCHSEIKKKLESLIVIIARDAA